MAGIHSGRFSLEKGKAVLGPKNEAKGPFTIVSDPKNKGHVTITTKDGDFIVILDGVYVKHTRLDKPLRNYKFLGEEEGDQVIWFWSAS